MLIKINQNLMLDWRPNIEILHYQYRKIQFKVTGFLRTSSSLMRILLLPNWIIVKYFKNCISTNWNTQLLEIHNCFEFSISFSYNSDVIEYMLQGENIPYVTCFLNFEFKEFQWALVFSGMRSHNYKSYYDITYNNINCINPDITYVLSVIINIRITITNGWKYINQSF